MRVLGIDPGYDRMGVAVLEKQNGKEIVLYSCCLSSNKSDHFSDRLLSLGDSLEKIMTEWQPNILAIEKLFLANNKKTATNISEVRGMIFYISRKHGLKIAEYTPMEIKQNISGYGGADKKQMIGMIDKLVTLPKSKRLDDEYDAIGAAITHLACAKIKGLG